MYDPPVTDDRPFDIVKVRVQTAPPGYFKGAYTQLTSGVGDCIAHIVKDEGAMAFYKVRENMAADPRARPCR